MRIHLKTVMVVGLLVLLVPLLLSYVGGVSGANNQLYVGLHQDSNSITNAACNNCHDKTAEDPSTDAQYPGAHRRHLISAKLNFWNNDPANSYGCGKCHEETVYGGASAYKDNSGNLKINYDALGSNYEGDLSYADTDTPNTNSSPNFKRAVRKQVKPGVCRSCHGKFNTDVTAHTGVDPKNPSCKNSGCHDNDTTLTTQHTPASSYVNMAYVTSNTQCGLCHGAFQWFQATETSETLP